MALVREPRLDRHLAGRQVAAQEKRLRALHPALDRDGIHRVVPKGTDPRIDSYSGFFDNGHRKQTELDAYLKSQGVKTLYLMGLATDYCVKWSALDALKLGYRVLLVQDGCRGVGLNGPHDVGEALREMHRAGATFITSQEVLAATYQ